MTAATFIHRLARITVRDRLRLSLLFAVALHAGLILGVSLGDFAAKPTRTALPTIEIRLVESRVDTAPEKPDYLAQANQDAGGMSLTPEKSLTSPPPVSPPPPAPPPSPEPAAQPPESTVMTQAVSPKKIAAHPVKPKTAPAPKASPPAPPSAATLINRSLEIASLSAQVAESAQDYAQRPRQKFISARTQEYKYASYMEAWRAKVERIGNLNYPDEAKRRNLSGSLILDVALNPNGSINNITLRRSSGEQILDNAAIRIVKLAAPYGPFPADIKKEVDILHITRTWQFLPDNRLLSK